MFKWIFTKQSVLKYMRLQTKPFNIGVSLCVILLVVVSMLVFQQNSKITNIAGANTIMLICIFGAALLGAVLIWFFTMHGVVRRINQVVAELTDGSKKVASAPSEVSAASRSLPASSSLEQAAGLAGTSPYLENIPSMTEQHADGAKHGCTLVCPTYEATDNGSNTVARMNSDIKEIERSSDEIAGNIKVIDKIAFQRNLLALNVIDEIAFQTNLLAADATAKATRAVEASKDLAVVAEQVRNLAARAAEAAKNSTTMMEESLKNDMDMSNEVTKVLEEIKHSFGKTTGLAADIVATLQEQADGGENVDASAPKWMVE